MTSARGNVVERRRVLSVLVAGAFCAAWALGAQASAQTLERHQAPGLQTPVTPPVSPPEPPADKDTRPLGPSLAAIVLLRADDPLAADARRGRIDSHLLAPPNAQALDRRLASFIGRPLSRALISHLEAAIVGHYRRAGRPFVAVKLPPQDITDAVLQLRVIEFRLGRKSASGASAAIDKSVVDGVRVEPGETIDAPTLQQDLDWLNHSPFRSVSAIFAPGDSTGATDLDLQVKSERPWQVFAGYANSGTPSDGLDRWILGGEVGDLVTPGSLLSFQMTTSDDFWDVSGAPFGDAANPQYVSYSLATALPLAPRQDLTVNADYIDSTTTSAAFQIRSHTEEVSAIYRTALSNVAQIPGDASFGIEVRGQQNDTYFGQARVAQTGADVAQLVLGWSDAWSDSRTRQSFSLNLRYSPGGLLSGNDNRDFLATSNGRAGDANYVYADLDYSGDYRIVDGWRYVTTLHAQFADQPLISTEQMSIGGDPGVRVYVYDDRSFDSGAVWRNELRTPLLPLLTGSSLATVASPYLFADAGYGQDLGDGLRQWAESAGAGSDWRIGKHLSGGLAGGWALEKAAYTHAGGFQLLANVRFTY